MTERPSERCAPDDDAECLSDIERMLAEIDRIRLQTHSAQAEDEPLAQLRSQIDRLSRGLERLTFEVQRLKENEAHEREKMALRLEVALLRFERRLPPSDREPDSQES